MPYPNQEGTTLSNTILHSIYSHPQVKGGLRLTAINIALKCNSSGIGRVAQSYLATRTGLHVRTIRRHIKRLVALGVLRATLHKCAWTLYQFLVPDTVHKRAADKRLSKIDRKREPLTAKDIPMLEKGLRYCTPGSEAYQSTLEMLQALRR